MKGGGISIAIKNTIYSLLINITVSSLQCLYILLRLKYHTFIIRLIYILPRMDIDAYDLYTTTIQKIYRKYPSSYMILLIYQK